MKVSYRFDVLIETDEPSGFEPKTDDLEKAIAEKLKTIDLSGGSVIRLINATLIQLTSVNVLYHPPVGILKSPIRGK